MSDCSKVGVECIRQKDGPLKPLTADGEGPVTQGWKSRCRRSCSTAVRLEAAEDVMTMMIRRYVATDGGELTGFNHIWKCVRGMEDNVMDWSNLKALGKRTSAEVWMCMCSTLKQWRAMDQVPRLVFPECLVDAGGCLWMLVDTGGCMGLDADDADAREQESALPMR